MKSRTIAAIFAFCATVMSASVGLNGGRCLASSLSLNFSSAGGSILDKDGQGTGFTTRLVNTGGALNSPNDLNLDIDTAAGVLHMTSTNADINGQRNLSTIEFFGVNLSSLGYTGTQNFSIHGEFINIPSGQDSFDQFGIFAARDNQTLTRAAVVNYSFFGGGNEGIGENLTNGNDADGNYFGQNPGTSVTFDISRTGGIWKTVVNGIDKTPLAQPGLLSPPNANDLTVGVWTYSTDDSQFVVDLDKFSATVAPEPASLGLAAIAALGLLVGRRLRKTATE
jgi:PEP-CTERM motif